MRNLTSRIARAQSRLLAANALNACDVTLRWREAAGLGSDYDPALETSDAATYTEKTATVRVFVHTVNSHVTGFVKHAQVESGDMILDFPGDVALDGKKSLRFEIGGKAYVQKAAGGELAESWDVRCGGIPITRTVLVTRM